MWIKIEIIPSEIEIIFLPPPLATDYEKSIRVSFGALTVNAILKCTNKEGLNGESSFENSSQNDDSENSLENNMLRNITENNTFENPMVIKLSSKLENLLMIPESLVYQMKAEENNIFIGPVIGLMLGMQIQRYSPRHMMKYSDRFGVYNLVGGLVYAFSPRWINWKKRLAYGLYYNNIKQSWEYGRFPLPEVIYRRNFHSDPRHVKRLIEITGNKLFNSYRFTKYELYEYVCRDAWLRKYLPPTQILHRFDQAKAFIDRYSGVILKPVDLSRGRGICIIEKTDDSYKISDYRHKQPLTSFLHDNEALKKFFSVNRSLCNRYIIQKYLPLARIGGSLFDIRVVMQKLRPEFWVCTGVECRVSNADSHITNISRGGYALPLDDALRQAFGEEYLSVSQKITDFCHAFCTYMDNMGEHFSEFGIDIAADTNKNIWLIEANVFPSFKGFKEMDKATYLRIRHAPLMYAFWLTRFGM